MAKRPRSNKRKPRNAKSDPLTPARGTRKEDLPRLTTAQRIAKRLQAARVARGESEAAVHDWTLTRRQQIVQAAIKRAKQLWHRAGWLTSEKGLPHVPEESPLEKAKRKHRASMDGVITGTPFYRFNQATRELLEEFRKKRVDPVTIEQILRGKLAPYVDFTHLYLALPEDQRKFKKAKTERRSLTKLRRSYQQLDRRIRIDPVLFSRFKRDWKNQYAIIQKALDDMQECMRVIEQAIVGVGVDKALSRQGFWTLLILALVEPWAGAGHSNYRAFIDIARLLSLAFPPFPNNPTLIKRRYFHHK